MWSFVRQRANKRWLWMVMCRRMRQIAAYALGDRSEETCRKLWEQIPAFYRNCRSFSDFWEAYQKVFPEATHECVGKESGQVSHVERWYNTLRQSNARFVRKTLSFSKSDLCTKSLQGSSLSVTIYHLLLDHYLMFLGALRLRSGHSAGRRRWLVWFCGGRGGSDGAWRWRPRRYALFGYTGMISAYPHSFRRKSGAYAGKMAA